MSRLTGGGNRRRRSAGRVPSHAGTRACRSVAAAIAAGARNIRSSRAGRNRHRKKIFRDYPGDYPRGVRNGFTCQCCPVPDTLPVAPALPVPFLFARHRGPVSLLRLPPRPCPRLLPALAAAVALPCLPRPKAPLTSFEQAAAGARGATPPLTPRGLLIFGMVCRIFKKAHGRSCSQTLLPRRGLSLPSGAQLLPAYRKPIL
jgi:hypothetical protein